MLVCLLLAISITASALITWTYAPGYLQARQGKVDTFWSVGFLEGADNKANIARINWNAVTHINDFGVSPDPQGKLTCDFGRHSCTAAAFTQTRASLIATAHSHQAKVLMSITDMGTTGFFKVTTPENLQGFVKGVMAIVKTTGYDGVDIDWEASIESSSAHAQLASLLKALRLALGSSRLLTADAIPDDWMYWSTQHSNLDRINFMAYDWEGNWNHYTWFNSALQSDPCDCVWSVDLIKRRAILAGIPARKINLGLPFYGDVSTGGAHGPRQSPATGTYVQTTYSQMLATYSSQMERATIDDVAQVPWFALPNGWVQFENPKSLSAKLSYVKNNSLGGWSLFTLNKDAPGNPLASAAANVLQSADISNR